MQLYRKNYNATMIKSVIVVVLLLVSRDSQFYKIVDNFTVKVCDTRSLYL